MKIRTKLLMGHLMKAQCKSLLLAVIASVSLLTAGGSHAEQPPETLPTGGKGLVLLPLIVSSLTNAFINETGNMGAGIFRRLYNSIFGDPNPQQQFYQPGGFNNPQFPANAAQQQPFPPSGQHQLQVQNQNTPSGVLNPSVAYTIEKLDPVTYNPVMAYSMQDGAPTLKTGDVFAIRYETNMPGQVKLENIDSTGKLEQLGTYNVLATKTNRIPSNKGIKMEGTPGQETLNIYFTPCRPPEALNHASVKPFENQLPVCGQAQLAGGKNRVQAKSMINLNSPDPTIAVQVAPEYTVQDAAMGTPTSGTVRINHENSGVVGTL